MMKINIAQLKKELGGTQTFSFQTSVDELALNQREEAWTDNVVVDGVVTNKGTYYEVTGTIHATLKESCSRCLESVVSVLTIPFSEKIRETGLEETGEDSEFEFSCFTGDEMEITDLIRENILLAKPLKPVCSENCRGLCPECGANLNISTCGCNPIKIDPRLAVLEKLLSKD
ncbi:DUF177 domain-containing protein [uncultured Sporomusa sp.]|nr:DUF177 domain-containing protein [uncultured Sporomusa sp.]